MKYFLSLLLCRLGTASSFSSNNPMFLSSTNYLNSLSDQNDTPVTIDSISDTSSNNAGNVMESYEISKLMYEDVPDDTLMTTAEITPDDHYAKNHPGAGWAGYKNNFFGGYLDNLSQNNFDEGKKADYGDDIRWGAQVYLDTLENGG